MLFISILTLITAKAVKTININHIQFTRISFLILLYAGALSYNALNIQSIGSGIGIYNGYFHITQITQIIDIIMFIVGGLILLSWPLINNTGEIKGDKYSTNYSIIILFSILGSSLLISSFDLISIYLSIELQSFGLYILSTLYRNSESSTSAGLKYFLLGALSSCIILLGSGIIYANTGITNLESLYILNSVNSYCGQGLEATINDYNLINSINSLQGINLGIILIFIGFLFKIAAAPLHNWSPDVYDEVPTIVTIWLTILPKLAILTLLLELFNNIYWPSYLSIGGLENYSITLINTISSSTPNGEINEILLSALQQPNNLLKNILLISSLLSLIIGGILGLSQIKIKRLLAYSTISHIGFILLALAINTEQSIDSFIFYILQYTLTNLNIFLIILALSYNLYSEAVGKQKNNFSLNLKDLGGNKEFFLAPQINQTNNDINYIYQFKGLFNNSPLLCISLAICLFSMAGIPPFIGFFSKQFVLYSALQNGYYFISLVAIIVSVISASYYLQIIKNMYNLDESINSNQSSNNSTISLQKEINISLEGSALSNIHSYIISILTIIIIFFFIKPSILLNGTQLLALSLFYN